MRAIRPKQQHRLRLVLVSVFLLLLIPAGTLAYLGYQQLQYESFYQLQSKAVELTNRLDRRAATIFAAEDAKSFVDFGFLVIGEGNFVQRSPLSKFPVEGDLPGLVSYFQVDAVGTFSTPLLPKATTKQDGDKAEEIEPVEYQRRLALQNQVRRQLAQVESSEVEKKRSQLGAVDEVAPAEAENEVARSVSDVVEEPVDYRLQDDRAEGQRVFERLNAPQPKTQVARSLKSVADLKLKETYASEADVTQPLLTAEAGGKSVRRIEKNVEPASDQLGVRFADFAEERLTTFESEVDPFQFGVIDENHFVLYRNVWREQQRFVQGAVIERSAFLEGLVGDLYRGTALAAASNLSIAYDGQVLHTYFGEDETNYVSRASEITGTLLYRIRLSAPVNAIELIFSFTRLPLGPGGTLVAWTTLSLLVVLVGGFLLLYRLGLRQIALGEQQQDFVSAVSHELKTPLTSIRMYGEILKAGWASEEKKRLYYEFIFNESERLTRLINNVLTLARFNRNGVESGSDHSEIELQQTTVGELVDLTRSKITSLVAHTGFKLVELHEDLKLTLAVDPDAFVQIMINLIDNALKFSTKVEDKKIEFRSRLRDGRWVEFVIRDYGPGVPRNQMKKIFKLFYRTERELTRETVGTGIGLALVHELAASMGGSVDVNNAEPGAEFRVRLPLRRSQSPGDSVTC